MAVLELLEITESRLTQFRLQRKKDLAIVRTGVLYCYKKIPT